MHPSLGDLLDSGEIDFAIMQVFEEFIWAGNRGGSMAVSYFARNELIISPMFDALFDCNIIWKSKYFEFFALEHYFYVSVMEEWVAQKKASMNAHERLLYWLFKKSGKGIRLGKPGATPYPTKFTTSPSSAAKASEEWELKSLYYHMEDTPGGVPEVRGK